MQGAQGDEALGGVLVDDRGLQEFGERIFLESLEGIGNAKPPVVARRFRAEFNRALEMREGLVEQIVARVEDAELEVGVRVVGVDLQGGEHEGLGLCEVLLLAARPERGFEPGEEKFRGARQRRAQRPGEALFKGLAGDLREQQGNRDHLVRLAGVREVQRRAATGGGAVQVSLDSQRPRLFFGAADEGGADAGVGQDLNGLGRGRAVGRAPGRRDPCGILPRERFPSCLRGEEQADQDVRAVSEPGVLGRRRRSSPGKDRDAPRCGRRGGRNEKQSERCNDPKSRNNQTVLEESRRTSRTPQ